MLSAKLQRGRRISPKIEQGTTIDLIGFGRASFEPGEVIDLAFEIYLTLRPSLFQNGDNFAGAFIAMRALRFFAGEVRANNVHRQAAFQHMVQSRQGTGQHNGLHLTAAHCCQ